MDIKEFLSPQHAVLDIRASEKSGLIRALAALSVAALGVPAERISEALAKREELGSTGTGGGVAIPHARMAEIKKPFGVLAKLARPVEFDAIDGEPVDIVFVLLLPATAAGAQLTALASVARKLRDSDCVGRLRRATTGDELYRALVK